MYKMSPNTSDIRKGNDFNNKKIKRKCRIIFFLYKTLFSRKTILN